MEKKELMEAACRCSQPPTDAVCVDGIIGPLKANGYKVLESQYLGHLPRGPHEGHSEREIRLLTNVDGVELLMVIWSMKSARGPR